MKIQVNIDRLKEISNALTENANLYSQELDNIEWRTKTLKDSETLLLDNYIYAYKIEKSGFPEEEYRRFASISEKYNRINDFYDYDVKNIKIEMEAGFERFNIPFDINLTKEQAFMEYCGCDQETARKAHDLINKIDKESISYEASIREKYNGNLFAQLGKENEQAMYEEKARAQQEKFNEAAEEFSQKIENSDFKKMYDKGVSTYEDFADKTVSDYAEQNNLDQGPRL